VGVLLLGLNVSLTLAAGGIWSPKHLRKWTEFAGRAVMIADNGDPAFPGMSSRDYFAATALQGMLAGGSIRSGTTNAEIATVAYGLADAMLKAREESK